jgi:hypothetical protein
VCAGIGFAPHHDNGFFHALIVLMGGRGVDECVKFDIIKKYYYLFITQIYKTYI